jgi:AbrB family looped-hinge helix DNA binding protein
VDKLVSPHLPVESQRIVTDESKRDIVLPSTEGNTFMASNLTSKGQVTVPKKVRDYLGLKPGVAVTFARLDNGEIALRLARQRAKPRPSKFAKLRGRATVNMTTEEIPALTRAT